jgi:hypothetical protein
MRLIKEYPGKITPFSQIQKLMKLWAIVFNREILARVVAGHFKVVWVLVFVSSDL